MANQASKKSGKPTKGKKPKDKESKKPKTKKSKGKSGKEKSKPKTKTLAKQADIHDLYQKSVQTPDADVEFFERVYGELRNGRKPVVLREDFCGTAFLSTTWTKSDPKRRAVGIDLDAPTLAWGREHNIEPTLGDDAGRVALHEANVLDGAGEKGDIGCAMNFSYCVFKTREELGRYFRVAFDCLKRDGVFFVELYGGTEATVALVDDPRECEGFTYLWEQETYNPITHETLCHIHFKFSDGSKITKAFTYDWRLWGIPELRELLHDAGFEGVRVYWETVDDDGDGTGEYEPTESEENQESWLVYLVATK